MHVFRACSMLALAQASWTAGRQSEVLFSIRVTPGECTMLHDLPHDQYTTDCPRQAGEAYPSRGPAPYHPPDSQYKLTQETEGNLGCTNPGKPCVMRPAARACSWGGSWLGRTPSPGSAPSRAAARPPAPRGRSAWPHPPCRWAPAPADPVLAGRVSMSRPSPRQSSLWQGPAGNWQPPDTSFCVMPPCPRTQDDTPSGH